MRYILIYTKHHLIKTQSTHNHSKVCIIMLLKSNLQPKKFTFNLNAISNPRLKENYIQK
jgi:hypothetical protein